MSLTNSNGVDSDFDLVLDAGQTTLRAYVTRAPDGTWVAWAPYFFRILRRQARALRSHLDLADDVVSTLYDPRDVRNTAAVYSLANVTDWGLLQLYGSRAVHPDRDTALALAEAGSARLVTALKGRYRKSVISPLTVPEATAYYYHLLNCRHVAALLGQPVRRMTSGAVSTDGIGQLVAADAQEQLETIVAGLEDVPFAIQCTLAPYAALEITALLRATAEELSRFASQVKGSDSLNISISPGSLLTPLSAVMQQNVRSTGISHVERRTVLESQAEELAASRQQAHATWNRTSASQESFAGHTDSNYRGGSHVEEHTVSHAEEQVDLQRDYTEQYIQHKSFTGVDQGALRTQDSRQVQQTGDRQTHTTETGQSQTHDSIDESTQGYRAGNGFRNENQQYSFSEGANFGSSKSWGGSEGSETTRTFSEGGDQSRDTDYHTGGMEVTGRQTTEEYRTGGQSDVRDTHFNHQTEARQSESAGLVAMGSGVQESAVVQATHGDARQISAAERSGDSYTEQNVGEMNHGSGYDNRDTAYANAGQSQDATTRTWGGSEATSGSEWRSGSGSRQTNTTYNYGENYSDQHHTDRDTDRTWQSQVAQDSDWRQQTAEQTQASQLYMKSYAGTYDETGQRQGHLSQQDQIVTDSDVQRTTDRNESGWRSEDQSGWQNRQSADQGDLRSQQEQLTAADSYARNQAASQGAETGTFAGASTTVTRGYAGPSGAGLFIGLGVSRQTLNAMYQTLANLLDQQVQRLNRGRDTGFFRVQTVLLAPDALTLERLVGAVVSAWREEEVVTPVTVITGDPALWHAATRFVFDERRENNPLHPFAFQQGMTSNEVAPLVHPVRVEGKGGSSASLKGWPDVLGLDRSPGEIELGLQISPTTDATTDLVARLAPQDLMHMLIVGASGSGKSNSAIYLASQVINRLRETDNGDPLPMPTTGPQQVCVPDGRPALGVTVFDPTGEWRRLAHLVLPTEFRFMSLTDPDFHGLHFNPVAIPSAYIEPAEWIGIVAKRWALAYATGATGVALMRRSLRQLYESRDVFRYPAQSQQLTLSDLYAQAQLVFAEMVKNKQVDNISPGVLKRILDKMEEFAPGGLHYAAFGQPGQINVADWLWPYGVTILEGDFGDDEMLKSFVIGLLGMATYQHAANQYKATIKQQGSLHPRRHLLAFEEAHVIMSGGDKTEAEATVEKTASLWDNIADRGRKYGLYALTVAQHWEGLPDGIVGSAKIVIAQGVNTLKDAETAAAALGIRPGRSAMDDVTQVLDKLLDMPVGAGIFKRKRLPKPAEERQKPVAVLFPDISGIEPPTDRQLDTLLQNAGSIAAQQRATWAQVHTALQPQVDGLLK